MERRGAVSLEARSVGYVDGENLERPDAGAIEVAFDGTIRFIIPYGRNSTFHFGTRIVMVASNTHQDLLSHQKLAVEEEGYG